MKYRTDSTFGNITSNFTFAAETITGAASTDTLSDISGSLTPAAINMTTDSATSYKVTLNVHSANVETYNGTVNNATSFGPIGFDCYDVVTTASSANFTNNITFAQSNGSSLPSWLTFDNTTANVSISSPSAVSSDTYTITNTYTGSLGVTFTLTTNATISIVEEITTNNTVNNTTNNTTTTPDENNNKDDDHCLNASSEGLCAFFVILIIFGVLAPVIIIGAIIYFKLRKPKVDTNRAEQLNQTEVNNVQDDNLPPTHQQNGDLNDEAMDIDKFVAEESKQI